MAALLLRYKSFGRKIVKITKILIPVGILISSGHATWAVVHMIKYNSLAYGLLATLFALVCMIFCLLGEIYEDKSYVQDAGRDRRSH